MNLDDGSRATLLIHYYRAMVGRADIWRMRMDTTTNWAIGATAALVSFALGNPLAPHYVIFVGSFLTLIFLLLEARRLTFYHLWQQRVLLLERALLRPALGSPDSSAEVDLESLELRLGPHLGTTIPSMSLVKAASRRLRRVYLYLFAVHLLAWLMKLSSDPSPASSLQELVSRADVGPIGGVAVMGLTGLGLTLTAGLAALRGDASAR